MQSPSVAHDGSYTLLPHFSSSFGGVTGLDAWSGDVSTCFPIPEVGVNTTTGDTTGGCTPTIPSGAVFVHPSASNMAIVAWTSPISAVVTISGGVIDLDSTCGDGIGWSVDQETTSLASGTIPSGGNASFPPSLTASVSPGTRIFFLVGSGPNGDQNCDTTQLCVSLSSGTTATAPPPPCASAPSVTISTVTATFYANPNNSSPFDASQLSTPVFTQSFPVINFNPPTSAQVACSNSTGVDENSRPFTDVVPNPDGTCSTQVAAGNTLQAGTGDLSAFEAVFTTNLTVDSAGQVTLDFFSDDGWILGLGQQAGGTAQPTYVSGQLSNPPSSSPVEGFPVVGALNVPCCPTQAQVTVNFPAAGTYPMEVDYIECCGGQLALTLGTTAGTPILPTPPATTTAITSVDPPWTPFSGGQSITIKGSFGTSAQVNFHSFCDPTGGSAVPVICFGFDRPATIQSASDSAITVTVPGISLYDAAVGRPNALVVTSTAGIAYAPFTYVVPEIGLLVEHKMGRPFTVCQQDPCTVVNRVCEGCNFDNCVAEAVQSANHRVILTAGHCAFSYDDFAFAPGYFGPTCTGFKPLDPFSSSELFGCGGTAPYGVWCALSSRATNPGCGETTSTSSVSVSPDFKNNPNTEDFGFIVTAPKPFVDPIPKGKPRPTTLGQAIGGELAIAFGWAGVGKNPNFNQSWNILGYNAGYLDTCNAPSAFDFTRYPLFPPAIESVIQIANPSCSFIVSGASGGPWINSENGSFYGIGADNDTANGLGGVTGAYMGRIAQALWNQAQSRR